MVTYAASVSANCSNQVFVCCASVQDERRWEGSIQIHETDTNVTASRNKGLQNFRPKQILGLANTPSPFCSLSTDLLERFCIISHKLSVRCITWTPYSISGPFLVNILLLSSSSPPVVASYPSVLFARFAGQQRGSVGFRLIRVAERCNFGGLEKKIESQASSL
jgi:hypothetical protein